jgi:hypothetical protein
MIHKQQGAAYKRPVNIKSKGKKASEWRPRAPIAYNTKVNKVDNDNKETDKWLFWLDILLRFTISFVSCYLILRFMG